MTTSMTDEQFYANLLQLPKPRYPFADYIHPDFQQLRQKYYDWIDTEYIIHSKGAREKHKKHHLCDIAARGVPFLKSIDELLPLANYTANGAMMDDYFDRCSRDKMQHITNSIHALLTGDDPREPAENGILHLFWELRQDALKFDFPDHIYKRFVNSIRATFKGFAEERIYYRSNSIAPLPVYLLSREATSGVLPYCDYLLLQKEYRQLPDEIFDHPHIKRVRTICCLMIGIHNDIISLPKELHREGDTMNIVKVLQKEHQIPVQEAYVEALELHDNYLKEFLLLQEYLPPFDQWQNMVYDYIQDLGIMVSGVYAWHTHDTSRYVNGGYVEGEYVSEG
ncbi:terpene synthase family protein [Niabella sp. 22666]|uniref:terpene synthase family protein n=1 Tax=Niabella sp. 22666 TaxID=3453954 RepID=UPI003F862E28